MGINGTRLVSAPCPFVSDSHATRVRGGAAGSKSRKLLLPEILGPRASVGSGNTTGTCDWDSRASGEPMGPSQVDSTRASQVGVQRIVYQVVSDMPKAMYEVGECVD